VTLDRRRCEVSRWVCASQQERDHRGLRDVCAACGHDGTDRDPLTLDDEGYRVHRSHTTDHTSGLYYREQKPRVALVLNSENCQTSL
jgi:hypothetical protein